MLDKLQIQALDLTLKGRQQTVVSLRQAYEYSITTGTDRRGGGVANTHDSHSFRQERIKMSKELVIASHVFQRRYPVVLEDFVESSLVSERMRWRFTQRHNPQIRGSLALQFTVLPFLFLQIKKLRSILPKAREHETLLSSDHTRKSMT